MASVSVFRVEPADSWSGEGWHVWAQVFGVPGVAEARYYWEAGEYGEDDLTLYGPDTERVVTSVVSAEYTGLVAVEVLDGLIDVLGGVLHEARAAARAAVAGWVTVDEPKVLDIPGGAA